MPEDVEPMSVLLRAEATDDDFSWPNRRIIYRIKQTAPILPGEESMLGINTRTGEVFHSTFPLPKFFRFFCAGNWTGKSLGSTALDWRPRTGAVPLGVGALWCG